MKTDERFLIVGEKEYNKYNLSEYPNFHKTGNKEGMRSKYYGEDACLVQAGNFIYHVDKEVFDKIKADMENLSFTYMGHEFSPVRQFNEKENLKIIGQNMWEAVPMQGNWNWDEFYQKATSIGAREIDIFRVDDKYEIIPTHKGIVVYGENSQKIYQEYKQTLENQELITDKIQNYLQGFINKWGVNPDIAEVNVKYHGGEELHCQIALNERTGRMADEQVMFTCSSMDEFKALVNENNGEDFQITDIYSFSSNEGINKNQERLHEAIADISMNIGAELARNSNLNVDSRDLVHKITNWAHQFEELHQDTDWDKTDYLSAIDEFSERKWNEYVGTVAPSIMEEAGYRQENMPVVSAMDDDHILATADKIGAVLERFYSLHEVDELTRIITDPDKGEEDVKAAMSVIFQRNKAEEDMDAQLARISHAMFIPSEKDGLCISAEIDGLLMPYKPLDNGDAEDIGKIDKNLLKQHEIDDKAADLALKYYEEELKMSYSDLVLTAHQSDLTLTKADARTFADLDRALEQKFPDGLTLSIPGFTVTDIYSYIYFGKFRDEDFVFAGIGEQLQDWDNNLKAEVVLPNKNLHQLVPAPEEYSNESYEDFINDLDQAEKFDASTTELMHRHPDLNGAKFTIYDPAWPKFVKIEGRLLDEAIAWVLQKPNINEDTLRKVLSDKTEEQNLLEQIKNTEVSDYDRERTAKMGMPEGLDMIQNRNKLYLFEKGVLGFAEVDVMRGVRYSGETMSLEAQNYINDMTINKNLKAGGSRTFFITPNVGCERKAYLDTMNNRLVKVELQKDIYGNVLYTAHNNILKEGNMQHFQDITGRITDARIVGINKPAIRCKIDGTQKTGRFLTKSDQILTGHFFKDSEDFKNFELSMAVKYFTAELQNSIGQNKGMKR